MQPWQCDVDCSRVHHLPNQQPQQLRSPLPNQQNHNNLPIFRLWLRSTSNHARLEATVCSNFQLATRRRIQSHDDTVQNVMGFFITNAARSARWAVRVNSDWCHKQLQQLFVITIFLWGKKWCSVQHLGIDQSVSKVSCSASMVQMIKRCW